MGIFINGPVLYHGFSTVMYLQQLAEDMIRFIGPIREKASAIYADKEYLRKIISEGAERSRESAQKTIKAAREMVGLNYNKL